MSRQIRESGAVKGKRKTLTHDSALSHFQTSKEVCYGLAPTYQCPARGKLLEKPFKHPAVEFRQVGMSVFSAKNFCWDTDMDTF